MLAEKYLQIRNRWRAKASFVPIGEFQGLLLGAMLTSKHDELELISFNCCIIEVHWSDVFEFVSSQGKGMQKHSKCHSDAVTNLPCYLTAEKQSGSTPLFYPSALV